MFMLQVDQLIHRMLVEADTNIIQGGYDKLWEAASEIDTALYKKGDLMESGIADLDTYLLKKVKRTSTLQYRINLFWT